MKQIETIYEMDIPEWLRKCLSCTHAYRTQENDTEMKCACRKGCNFKQAKGTPIYINKDLERTGKMSAREIAKIVTEALDAEREAYLELLEDGDYARIEDELCEYLSAE